VPLSRGPQLAPFELGGIFERFTSMHAKKLIIGQTNFVEIILIHKQTHRKKFIDICKLQGPMNVKVKKGLNFYYSSKSHRHHLLERFIKKPALQTYLFKIMKLKTHMVAQKNCGRLPLKGKWQF